MASGKKEEKRRARGYVSRFLKPSHDVSAGKDHCSSKSFSVICPLEHNPGLSFGADLYLWFAGFGHYDEIDRLVAKALFDGLGLLGQKAGNLIPVRGTHLAALMDLDKLLVQVVHLVGLVVGCCLCR